MAGGKTTVKKPIVRRLILLIGVPLLVVYSTVLILNYLWGRDRALQQTKDYLVELTSHHAAKLDSNFAQIAQTPTVIADALQILKKPTEEEMYSLITKRLESSPHIFGMAIAFEPFWSSMDVEFFAPYVYRERGKLAKLDLAQNYDYLTRDWYSIPRLLDRSYWTEPYYDEGGGNILMCTFSTPIRSDGKFIGIATSDISLEELESQMESIKIMAGYTFIISRNGTFIYHPNQEYVMSESIFSLAEEYDHPYAREVGKNMIKGMQGVTAYNDFVTGAKKWLVYTPIPSCQWSFAAVIPEEDVLASVNASIIRQSFIMVIGLVVIILIIVWASVNITNPIRRLAQSARELATGNLDVQIENIKGDDEIHELAEVFNQTVADLRQYVEDLTEATRVNEAVESELRIARQIQESLIPRTFPPFPDRKEFDLYAENIPAKEVAGDFYDFFFVDEDKLAVIIADVSGKGIHSALFMAVTRTLMKIACQKGVSPAQALERVNNVLSEGNDACMFTTLFLAIYDVNTGKFIYANAGHNPPIILSQNGNHRTIESFGDIPLGLEWGDGFDEAQAHLDVGESLVLYTDGITEAMAPDESLYGEERFIGKLAANASDPIEVMWRKVVEDLNLFQAGNQADDITVLFLKRNIHPLSQKDDTIEFSGKS